ncbi:uncharacterized protein TNCV_1253551 [Trichonephila clavipes]|nr:uncharacterized protein TNCV_1253551 [Trichonephila clavipes]
MALQETHWCNESPERIRRDLQFACETEVQFQDVWILTDGHASVQHLSNWTFIEGQTGLDILNLLDPISSYVLAHFQWVPSHVGIDGNEKADFLSRTAAEKGVTQTGSLTFRELSSLIKIELNHQGELLLVIHGTSEDIQEELWFQQDGATCHTARATIDLLKDTFGDRLISRFGPVNWPPRSCDLTLLDYFLWGYVKLLVYADKTQTLDHLEDNIRRVIANVRPQMLEKVIENWT